MTKKEQAKFDLLQMELRIARALRYTEEVKPDVPPPTDNSIVNGYLYNAHQGVRVEKSCTSSASHSFGYWNKTDSQRPTHLYSSRLLALRAGRFELARKFGQILALVDAEIEQEKSADGFSKEENLCNT